MPVSAHEWADSATIEADPVTIAATDFAIATPKLAPNAMTTVRTLSPPAASPARRGPRSGRLVTPRVSHLIRRPAAGILDPAGSVS